MYPNTGMRRRNISQPREEIVALGSKGYQNATNDMVSEIGILILTSAVWESKITTLRRLVDGGENPKAAKRLEEAQQEADKVKNTIEYLNELHSSVSKS